MRMLAALAALALATPSWAADVALPVTIRDGATWTMEARRVREDVRTEGPRKAESTSRYKVAYRRAGDVTTMTLTPDGASVLGDLPPGFKPEDFSFPLELEVDESLTPVRLVNWPQVRATLYKVLDGQDPKVLTGMRSLFDPMSDAQAAAMFMPQLNFLGLGQGLALTPGEPLTYDDRLPNPMGGPPILAKGAFALDGRDAARKETAVVWTQALDQASMAASMKVAMANLLERMAPEVDKAKLEATLKDASMSRDSRCRFVIDDASGLAHRTECATTIDMKTPAQSARRTDTWTITQSPPEYR